MLGRGGLKNDTLQSRISLMNTGCFSRGSSSRGSLPHAAQAALSALGSCNLLGWGCSLCKDACTEGSGDVKNT